MLNSFKHWPIGRKLKVMSYILLANMLIAGGVGLWTEKKMTGLLEAITQDSIPAIRNITLIDMMHNGIHGLVYRARYAAVTKNPDLIKEVEADAASYKKDADEYFELLSKIEFKPETLENIKAEKDKFLSYADLGRIVAELYIAGKISEGDLKLSEFGKEFTSLEESLEQLGEHVLEESKRHEVEGRDFGNFASRLAWAVIAVSFLVGILLPASIFRSLLSTMNSTIERLTSEASEVRKSASGIRVSSENLSSATTEQASALQETASSIEEMNAMVKKSSDNASRSQDVSKASHSASSRGKEAVEHMMKAITDINESNDTIMNETEKSNRRISEIVKVIQEIGNKTKVINDIVFQTKLLSFNASVEAARAGEHGKGFAVVAEEVGNLAAMSGNAAKEISEMLDGSIKQVETIIGETKRSIERLIAEGKQKVEAGTNVAKQCSSVLDEVVTNVTQVDSMIQEIATASREQAQGIGEITRAMNQLDQVTHQNSTTSTQVAGASEQLARQSNELMDVVTSLKDFVHGRNSHQGFESQSPTAKMDFHPQAAEKIVELTSNEIDSAKRRPPAKGKSDAAEFSSPTEEIVLTPLTETQSRPNTKRPVPGVGLSKLKMSSSAGTLDSIPSESDERFKDF